MGENERFSLENVEFVGRVLKWRYKTDWGFVRIWTRVLRKGKFAASSANAAGFCMLSLQHSFCYKLRMMHFIVKAMGEE